MLQMNDLEQATEIHVDECYVMMIRNFPGRVKVTENGDFISVTNVDTGVSVSHVDQASLYYLPTELTKYQAAAIPLRMNTIDFNLPKGTTITITISGWNQTYEAYDAEFIRQLSVSHSYWTENAPKAAHNPRICRLLSENCTKSVLAQTNDFSRIT